jgi:phosphate transport system substrate-binding protein
LSGSTTTQPLVADLAYFYRRETRSAPRVQIVGGGTESGIADTARGIVTAGMMSRALAPGDPPGLVFTPIAYSAICLVTNAANPVPNLTRAQIQDLVAGRISTWAQIAGSPLNVPLVPAAQSLGTSARTLFRTVFVDLETEVAYQPRTFATAAQMRSFVMSTPAAWGYVDLAFARGLHAVLYEGVACAHDSVRSGAYAARRPLGLVTRGRPRGALGRFLRWIARDATAKRVIASRYVVP